MFKRSFVPMLGLIIVIMVLGTFLAPASVVLANSPVCNYQVQNGDNLWSIAQRFDQTVDSLVLVNQSQYPTLVTKPELVYPGWQIIVPCDGALTILAKPYSFVINVNNSGPDNLLIPRAEQVYELGDGKVGFFSIGTPGYKIHAWVDIVEAATKDQLAVEFYLYSPHKFQAVRASWYEDNKVIQPTGSGTLPNFLTALCFGSHDRWYDGGQGSFKEPWWGLVINRTGWPLKFKVGFEDQPAICFGHFPCEETAEVFEQNGQDFATNT